MPLFCHSDVEALKYIINHVASYSMFCLDGSECCFYIQYFEHDDDDDVCVWVFVWMETTGEGAVHWLVAILLGHHISEHSYSISIFLRVKMAKC